MSFQLILAPVAFAQQAETGVDNYKSTGTGSAEGDKQYINSMLMTGSGAFGSLFINCQSGTGQDSSGIPRSNTIPTFSHYIFMAGAIVLLVGEIVAATKQQKRIKEGEEQAKRLSEAVKPGEEQTQEQKDAQLHLLNTALVEEQENRDALKQRQNWMTAAEVVYWLAVAGATTEIILYAVTKALMATSTALKVPPIAVGYPAAYAAEQAVGYYSWRLGNCVNDSNKLVVLAIGAAYGIAANAGKGAQGAVMGGVSTAAFMYMMYQLLTTFGQPLNAAMATAPGRLVIFGMFAALASTVRSGYKKKVEQAEKNIAGLKKAITDWQGASTVTSEIAQATVPGTEEDEVGDGTKKAAKLKTLAKNNKTGKCLGPVTGGVEHSSKACAKPIKFNRGIVNFKSNFLKGAANQAFDMGEAMANDNMDGANAHAAGLASNAARVKAEALALIDTMNADRKKKGEKTIDFDKEVKAQLASISKMGMDAAKGSGAFGSGAGLATLDKEEPKTDETTPEVTAAVVPAAAEATPDLSLLGASGEELAAETPVAANAEQSLDDFESTEQDVSKKAEVSIFKQLSNRYILNYTKIFDRKKTPEAVPEEPKKN